MTELARRRGTITYCDLAKALEVQPPNTIHQVTDALREKYPQDELHNVVAHGFKQALEKFGVELDMPKHEDRQEFHGQVAHALLESHRGLSTIAHYHAIGSMPGEQDELHDQAAHGFKHALELFGVKTNM